MAVIATDADGNILEAVNPTTLVSERVTAAGSVIGNAASISSTLGLSIVAGADDTKGVVLPAAQIGKEIKVYNNQATNGLKVYPPVNSTINGGSANAAITIEGLTLAIFVGTSTTNWAAMFTANS